MVDNSASLVKIYQCFRSNLSLYRHFDVISFLLFIHLRIVYLYIYTFIFLNKYIHIYMERQRFGLYGPRFLAIFSFSQDFPEISGFFRKFPVSSGNFRFHPEIFGFIWFFLVSARGGPRAETKKNQMKPKISG